MEKTAKRYVFLSHATPEDNEFTRWLAARLQAEGYQVWADLNDLDVGDRFWPEIEVAIREHSAKFVSIVSRRAASKPGFRRELSMADSIERGMPAFILPVRIDDYPFADLPAQIHDKHVVDFSSGWQTGLGHLLKRLREDMVPREESSVIGLSGWAADLLKIREGVLTQEEALLSNWLPIQSLPTAIRLHQYAGEPVTDAPFKAEWPSRLVGDVAISFARTTDFSFMKHYPGKVTTVEVALDSFLDLTFTRLQALSQKDRRSILIDLIRQSWELHAKRCGMLAYEMSNRQMCWYLPWTATEGKKLEFMDSRGKRGRRALNGVSGKLGVKWHFAVRPFVMFGPPLRFALQYTVVFTEDGTNPLEDKHRAHRLRRTFCKNWWQDRWRDMLSAYIHYLKRGGQTLELPLGADRKAQLSPFLEIFHAPVSALDPARPDILEDEVSDQLAGSEVAEGEDEFADNPDEDDVEAEGLVE